MHIPCEVIMVGSPSLLPGRVRRRLHLCCRGRYRHRRARGRHVVPQAPSAHGVRGLLAIFLGPIVKL
jgi:hypothetical protein